MEQILLSRLIAAHCAHEGRNETAIKDLHLSKACRPGLKITRLYDACLCIIAQGKKQLFAGQQVYTYEPAHFLLVSVDLPLAGQVIEASAEKPYLGLQIRLDPQKIAPLLAHTAETKSPAGRSAAGGIGRGAADAKLIGAITRLVALLENPQDIPALSPLILSEIYYRLLQSSQGHLARAAALPESHAGRIAAAIEMLKTEPEKAIKIEELAAEAHMSLSAFHRYFKAITQLSPLQYQKHLRLTEARRLMLQEDKNAAQASYCVGYQSASQFSREYKGFFGTSPKQDIAALKMAG